MRIEDIQVSETSEYKELSGRAGDFRLWFRVAPEYNITRSGDPFLAAFMLPSMLRGEPLEIDPEVPVSERLFRSVPILQETWNCWNPAFKEIPVVCKTQPKVLGNEGIASFYSGGVDSNYTMLTNREKITHLVAIRGFDFIVEEGGIRDSVMDRLAAAAALFQKRLVPVATNIRLLVYPFTNLGWRSFHGSALASVGLLLGFREMLVPSSHTHLDVVPSGSHPMTDPRWSTEATEFIHDGLRAPRTLRVQTIAAQPDVLSRLRVCWEDPEVNCGRCGKCVRTMITLRLLGVRSPAFPEPPTTRQVRALNIHADPDRTFFVDNLELAEKLGDRPMQKALLHCLRKYERNRLARSLDAQLFRGWFRRRYVTALKLAKRQDPDRHARRVDFRDMP